MLFKFLYMNIPVYPSQITNVLHISYLKILVNTFVTKSINT